MIKLVAFDWNGTILDDLEGGVRAESEVRKFFGYKETTLAEVQEQFVIPIRQYWINAGFSTELFDANSAKIDEIFMKYYEPEESICNVRTGTAEILGWLENQKIQSVIFSNHIVPHIDKQTTRLGIRKYFQEILARPMLGDVTHHTKTFKDVLLKNYIETQGIKPAEVIVVGDTLEEIEIGHRFGYHSVALMGGWQSTERLKTGKPEHLIDNLVELKDIIAKL